MKLVVDQPMFNFFVETVLQPLLPNEVYFVSMSARNKYLTVEERQQYSLGRTEMFGRTLGHGDWNYTMAKLGSVLDYKRTKNGVPYPEKALVVYVNVNPSCSVKACANFTKVVQNVQTEMVNSFVAGKTPNLAQLQKGDRLLMNEYQKATGSRHFVDMDVDAPEGLNLDLQKDLQEYLLAFDVRHHLVKTRGGYHFLVYRESLNRAKSRLHEKVQALHNVARQFGGEVMFNGNAMVAMPGTMQGGHLVELVY